MGKRIVGVTRFFLLCAVVLVLRAVAASQPAPPPPPPESEPELQPGQPPAGPSNVHAREIMYDGLPKSVHTRLVHLGGNLCVFLGSDFLYRCGDRWLIVEF
jgi:hypothetical protein